MRSKITITLLHTLVILLFFSLLHSQQTIIDTVYSIPYLDGGITHCPELELYSVGTNDGYIAIGDYYNNFDFSYYFNRGFISFDLPTIPEGYYLDSVYVNIYQYYSESNMIEWIYPIFNMPEGDVEPPCIIEHLDYGNYLDEDDFFAPILHYVGVISETPEAGWRTIDVTDCVLDDIESERSFTQYRLRLTLNRDMDPFYDLISFRDADTSTGFYPHIIYYYSEESNVLENTIEQQSNIHFTGHPNPFKSNIYFEIKVQNLTNLEIQIYNIKGQKVDQLQIRDYELGINNVVWNAGNQSSGLYFCKLINSDNEKILTTQKILHVK